MPNLHAIGGHAPGQRSDHLASLASTVAPDSDCLPMSRHPSSRGASTPAVQQVRAHGSRHVPTMMMMPLVLQAHLLECPRVVVRP